MTYVRFAPALLMCWLATVVDAQVMIDDFSDLDFVTGTLWEGNQDNFIVNAAQQLQLNDDVAAQSVLYTGFSDTPLAQKEWRFWIHQSFAGSDNNQSRVYFAAQGIPGNYTGAGSAGVTGYFLKFGEAGSLDKIKLCRDDGTGSITELAESTDDISGGVLLYIRI
ncbi:MAG: hypothetical protein JNM00_03025, partial [Flavobacteriales bacterium]|nr:hypothetical protein [Flavobacteriales bacterium]